MTEKPNIELLLYQISQLQAKVEALEEKQIKPLWVWKEATEKTASKITGILLGVTAIATAISMGFEKAVSKILGVFQ